MKRDYRTVIGILEARLKGESYSWIQRKFGIGSSTVTRIAKIFQGLGISFEELCRKEPAEVVELFYTNPTRRKQEIPLPDFEPMFKRMSKSGSKVNKSLLWIEYKQANQNGYEYTQFVKHFNEYIRKNIGDTKLSMVMNRIPGQRVFIDWMGDRPRLLKNKDDGKLMPVHIFVTTVGISSYIYAEAFLDEKQTSFNTGTAHALKYYDAIPQYLVPDNCKTAVTKHTKDTLIINAAFKDLAEQFNTIVLPPRARVPKGKASVENAVRYLETHLCEPLKAMAPFDNLEEINFKIREILEKLNTRVTTSQKYSRRDLFEKFDKPDMKPYQNSYQPRCEYQLFRVPRNYHIKKDDHYYSVPFSLVGQLVIAKFTSEEVVVCDEHNKEICRHKLVFEPLPKYITYEAHMPENHKQEAALNKYDSSYYRSKAMNIGPSMGEFIDQMLKSYDYEPQAYRSCSLVLGKYRNVSYKLLNDVAQECLEHGKISVSAFDKVMESFGVEGSSNRPKRVTDSTKPQERASSPKNVNLRGNTFK